MKPLTDAPEKDAPKKQHQQWKRQMLEVYANIKAGDPHYNSGTLYVEVKECEKEAEAMQK